MRLSCIQRDKMDEWLLANMTRRHSATWAACQLAPLLGLGEPPLEWEVLHPLAATVRARCRSLGIRCWSPRAADNDAQWR
ncbi:MAG: hypothetical protein IJ087_13315 [Eggerthellaceae bacterium]|nr:hypothetical protein [Eggerthellaceae bacterium]